MGSRGRIPVPTEVAEALGIRSHHAKNRDEPKPQDALPDPPKWLTKDERAVYRQVLTDLTAMRVGRKPDLQALCRYCATWVRWREVRGQLAKFGETFPVKDKNGAVVGIEPSPYVGIEAQLAKQLLQLEREFGLTPSARTRIKVENDQAPMLVPSRIRCSTN